MKIIYYKIIYYILYIINNNIIINYNVVTRKLARNNINMLYSTLFYAYYLIIFPHAVFLYNLFLFSDTTLYQKFFP